VNKGKSFCGRGREVGKMSVNILSIGIY